MAGTPRRKPGWMGMHIEGLRARLLERGYTPGSIKLILTLAGQLGRWMQTADVKFSQLDSAAVESFLDSLRARGVRRVPGPRDLRPLLDYLDSEGALAFKPIPDSPVEQLVAEYRTWLVVDRGWRRRLCCATRTWLAGSSASNRPQTAARSRSISPRRTWSGSCCARASGSAWARSRAGWRSCGRYCDSFCDYAASVTHPNPLTTANTTHRTADRHNPQHGIIVVIPTSG